MEKQTPKAILELYVDVLIRTLCARIDFEEGKSGTRRLNRMETKLANLEAAVRNGGTRFFLASGE